MDDEDGAVVGGTGLKQLVVQFMKLLLSLLAPVNSFHNLVSTGINLFLKSFVWESSSWFGFGGFFGEYFCFLAVWCHSTILVLS